jgi:hypothetical protein
VIDGRLLSPGMVSADWRIAAAFDVNGDGRPDVLFQHREG